MKVLVATHETNGRSAGDFCCTVAGELVRPPLSECDDADCGCRRGFVGLGSQRATTTVEVVDRPDLTSAELLAVLGDDVDSSLCTLTETERAEALESVLAALTIMTSTFEVGSVLERDGSEVRLRAWFPEGAGA